MNKVLVYGEEEELRGLPMQLRALGAKATTTHCADTATKVSAQEGTFDAVFARVGAFAAGQPLGKVTQLRIGVAVPAEIDQATSVLGTEIDDCLMAPIATGQLRLLLARTRRLRPISILEHNPMPPILGISGGLAKAWNIVEKVSRRDTSVLITGESGTGKELFAQAIHSYGELGGPFVAINCAAIPPGLLESQLFGHKKGAFTDAHSDKEGVFRKADGGTLFLDEVGDFPTEMQVKLLRALQTGEIQPLGAEEPVSVKIRLISATSRNLEKMVESGEFRDDLYYRLATIPIVLPPLRERKGDIGELLDHALAQYSKKHGGLAHTLDKGARDLMVSAAWPGNVRQLHNAVERLVILADTEEISEELVRSEIAGGGEKPAEGLESRLSELCLKDAMRVVEGKLITVAMQASGGKRVDCAKRLCISPRTLLYKLKEHKLQGVEF